jgi:peptidoglycan/xylan/chitin deacetylase (PgdA/CDA1 family)
MFKYKIPYILQLFYPNYTWKVNTQQKVVYFTFDDGPHPEITTWVLSELAKYNAKATFFMVGANIEKYPEIVEKVKQSGNAIGNHTFNHLNGWKTKDENYFENINKCKEFIESNLFRPPYGRIKSKQAKHILKKFKVIMWDKLSRDYDANLKIDESLKAMKTLPANGSIFVFHDSEKAFKNLKILLPELLNFYSLNGYQFEKLS